MTYQKDKTVTIKTNMGEYKEGVILQLSDFPGPETWWIQYNEYGRIEVSLFMTEDLDIWNKDMITSTCNCGAWVTNQPGHSFWCSGS